jgi:hypothetical protein
MSSRFLTADIITCKLRFLPAVELVTSCRVKRIFELEQFLVKDSASISLGPSNPSFVEKIRTITEELNVCKTENTQLKSRLEVSD